MKYNFVCQLISIYCLLFLKLSICLFIARLGPRPIYKRICYGTAIILSLYTVACGFTIIFQCTPVEKIWDRTGVEGTCLSRASLLGLSYAHTGQSRKHSLRSGSSIDSLHSCKCLCRFLTCRRAGPYNMERPTPNPPESGPQYCAGTRSIVRSSLPYIFNWNNIWVLTLS